MRDRNINIFKSGALILTSVILVFVVFFILKPNQVGADPNYTPPGSSGDSLSSSYSGSINVSTEADKAKAAEKLNALTATKWTWKQLWDKKWELLRQAGGTAFKAALGVFLNNLAYDTATYLATGDKGQSPMFYTSSWTEYLTDAADAAAGVFLEKLVSGIGNTTGWWKNFNVCDPNISVKIKIALGLYNKRKTVKCTFSQLSENWEQKLSSPTFLNDFQNMFNPWENDMGIALIINAGSTQYELLNVQAKTKEREEGKGTKSLTDKIAGYIKTPASTVLKAADVAIEDATTKEKTYTGTVADAIDTFINTLMGRLIEQWLKQGLVDNPSPDIAVTESDLDFSSYEGIEAAKERFRTLIEPSFSVRGDYNILSELSICPNPSKAGPTNCVITEKFRQAITNRLTVGDAIEQGYIKSSGKFGFISGGTGNAEPSYKDEDYPYRSMIILRKFRIVPVGWEVAAQYILAHPAVKSCTIGDMVSCFDEDSYTAYKTYQSGSCIMTDNWCRGLVDPNWVLKAPLNYCRKEGSGPIIESSQTTGTGTDSKLEITRNDNYCADEQSCIKENSDGSCQIYGYCTEERRTWDFNTKSCQPKYNTCQTFRSSSSNTVSYLENTLNYSGCNAKNAGCKEYCTEDGLGGWQCGIGKGIFLNNNAETCDQDEEGCHEFIRTKDTQEANLLPNSSFENDLTIGGWSGYGTANAASSAEGTKSLELASGGLMKLVTIGAKNYELGGRAMALSFYAKDCGSNGKFGLYDNSGAELDTSNLFSDNSWKRFSLSYTFPKGYGYAENLPASFKLGIKDYGTGCVIDAVKLETGRTATDYSDYRAKGLIYEKLIPNYLETSCYINSASNDYRLKDNAPSACSNFARKCNADEVDCELYTSDRDGSSIPASVTQSDYCPSECKGYDLYIQKDATFDTKKDEYFIPSTAKKCSSESVGCDQFTNLDEAAKKGEAKENYTYLRQCIKKDDAKSNCSEFYTWEGSDESGFQLKVFNLQTDDGLNNANDDGAADETAYDCNNDGTTGANECLYHNDPSITEDDRGSCNEWSYNLPITDGKYNSNCRQFYNRAGEISYHLFDSTISCSDNCHPYRRTEKNILYTLDQCNKECGVSPNCACTTACSAAEGKASCKLEDGQYVFCKNGGKWNAEQESCLYTAVPGEGRSCAASQIGCREYSGNRGSNMRTVVTNDFETETLISAWQGEGGSTIESSAISLRVGGHSLLVKKSGTSAKASTYLASLLNSGSSYTLTFLARTSAASISAAIINSDGTANTSFSGGAVSGSDGGEEWRMYRYNIESLGAAAGEERLVLGANSEFYLDDVKLVEIVDRYYLIKNSWQTPVSCDNSMDEPEGRSGCFENRCAPQTMAGCDQYYDRDNKTHYLKSFTKLCQESAVGCELMIDTKNSTSASGQVWNDKNNDGKCDSTNDNKDCVAVGNDSFTYAVYDSKYDCNEKEKGCMELGATYKYDGQSLYSKTYLLNDPDQYDQSLCTADAEGCDSWTNSDSSAISYFKDPFDQACEWKTVDGISQWWRKKVKRCDEDGDGSINEDSEKDICLENKDCQAYQVCTKDDDCDDKGTCGSDGKCHYKCVTDTNSYDCAAAASVQPKTLGTGGVIVSQTTQGWAGICSSSESGCSEYVDPISQPSANLVFNSTYSDIDNTSPATPGDGWNKSNLTQALSLKAYTLYILQAKSTDSDFSAKVYCDPIYIINSNNQLASQTAYAEAKSGQSVSFYVTDPSGCYVKRNSTSEADDVLVKKGLISYQLRGNIDYSSCNGLVNFDNGCVLFNERIQNGASLAKLTWDADLTTGSQSKGISPETGEAANRDSNQLIKVSPNRICDKWLSCRSAVVVKDSKGTSQNVCYDIGACNSVDDSGKCDSYVNEDANPLIVSVADTQSAARFANVSGYSKVGLGTAPENGMRGFMAFGAMKQDGEIATVPNGNFETYGSNGYPTGWLPYEEAIWTDNLFSVIDNPYSAQQEEGISGKGGIAYPVEGVSFLRYSSEVATSSPLSEMIETQPNTEYILSFKVNTLNLKSKSGSGNVRMAVIIEDGSSNEIKRSVAANGLGWRPNVVIFKSGSGTAIRLHLAAIDSNGYCRKDTDCLGNIYIDDIKIMPALEAIKDAWHVTQSCRLYPETNSLSCDYFDDSGVREKGWPGYCLEYDRSPGSTDACLLWWPVDRVKGDGVEEGYGYNGKFPVYYSLEGKAAKAYVYRHAYYGGSHECTSDCVGEFANDCPANYNVVRTYCTDYKQDIFEYECVPDGKNSVALDGSTDNFKDIGISDCPDDEEGDGSATAGTSVKEPVSANDGWYTYSAAETTGSYKISSTNKYATYLCDGATSCTKSAVLYRSSLYATKIVQTVTPSGQNKFWSSRVYKGSAFTFPTYSLSYKSYDTPFGSVVPGEPAENPYEWDSRTGDDYGGKQPLYSEKVSTATTDTTDTANAGQVFKCVSSAADCAKVVMSGSSYFPYDYFDFSKYSSVTPESYIKNIFAQSYGFWKWQDSVGYVKTTEARWTPPSTRCPGSSRPDYSDSAPLSDYCAIAPKVENIKVNAIASGNVSIKRNGYANLTFNSKVDSQQLPMTMVAIDWGDEEKTTITGAEMRDRQSTSDPHSLYHLYDFWDLKRKAALSGSGISCGGTSCTIQPKIMIKDNWGWCNSGTTIFDCDQWANFSGHVVVTEN